MFNMFKKQDKPPRIAYRETRDGTRYYYVQTWNTVDCIEYKYWRESDETTSLEEAEKMRQEISNKETVRHGVV